MISNNKVLDFMTKSPSQQSRSHVDRAPGLDVVELERLVVRELLARVHEADHYERHLTPY